MLVAGYPSAFNRQRSLWLERIRAFHSAGKRVVLWGGGSKAVAFLTTLGLQDEVEFVVDINPFKQGGFLPGTGHVVVGPEHLTHFQPDLVISMNPIYCEEIRKDLDKLGLDSRLETV